MIYAMSDIHGQYELFRNLMEQIPLGKDDTLYVLGDVVDRGPDSMNTLKYMMANPNIIPIMGNHELMALPCLKLLVPELSKEFLHKLSSQARQSFCRMDVERRNQHNSGVLETSAGRASTDSGIYRIISSVWEENYK